jgi:hypothetical protein
MNGATIRRGAALSVPTILAVVIGAPGSASAFDFFEHEYLGELACRTLAALPENRYPLGMEDDQRVCGVLNAHYVAVAGDHAPDAADLYEVSRDVALSVAVSRQREAVYAWLSSHGTSWDKLQDEDLRELSQVFKKTSFEEQIEVLAAKLADDVWVDSAPPVAAAEASEPTAPEQASVMLDRLARRRPDCFAPPKAIEDEFARLDGYVDLAMRNYSHFGWAAQDTYLKELAKARDGDRIRGMSYAAHFLTDEYASGHVRVERNDLPLAVAKYQHDWDNRSGLAVRQSFFAKNHRTDIYWRAFGDRCLLRPESRATRLLAAFSVVQAARGLDAPDPVTWTRPVAWLKTNAAVETDYTEHFNVTLSLGGRVPFRGSEDGPSDVLRTRVGLEYMPPLSAAFVFGGAIELEATRQIVLVPFGVGFHGARFVGMLDGAFRWSTARQYLELGPELSAGYAVELFNPLEVRFSAIAASFFHKPTDHDVMADFDLSLFGALVYRFDR